MACNGSSQATSVTKSHCPRPPPRGRSARPARRARPAGCSPPWGEPTGDDAAQRGVLRRVGVEQDDALHFDVLAGGALGQPDDRGVLPARVDQLCGVPRRCVEPASARAAGASTTMASGWSAGTPRSRSGTRNSEVYSSWENSAIIRLAEGTTRQDIEMQRVILLQHRPAAAHRAAPHRLPWVHPQAVNSLRDALARAAERIVHEAVAGAVGTSSPDVACELPLQAIAELLGIPRRTGTRSRLVQPDDLLRRPGDRRRATGSVHGVARLRDVQAEERKACPMDDIVTKLVQADVDGRGLNSDEFGFFVLLLAWPATRPPATRSPTGLMRCWTTRAVGALQGRAPGDGGRRESSAGPPRWSPSSAPPRWTPSWAARPSPPASGSDFL